MTWFRAGCCVWACLVLTQGLPLRAQEVGWGIAGLTDTGQEWLLAWPSAGSGKAYTVQARTAFGAGLWISQRGAEAPPLAATEWRTPRVGGNDQRFFRVVAVEASRRGALLTGARVTEYTQFQLALLLAANGISVTPSYGVRVVKLTCETVDPLGGRTVASGVLALPSGSAGPWPLVSYQHGTLVLRSDAPSTNMTGETLVGVILASTGYAVAVPDFLGFGESPGLHPYHHASSEATSCVDFLRAARAFCTSNAVGLSGKLFLCGYSQGGHATLALQRELESYHAQEFPITASAPMAGAYDLSGVTLTDSLSGRPLPNPYYFAYLLGAYQSVYRFTNRLADLLRPPYRTTLAPLLDGRHSGAEINAIMPANPAAILVPEIEAAFRADANHPFRLALRDNDLLDWAPRAPTRLYHCGGDLDVLPENTRVAREAFHALGATQVERYDPAPQADHSGCALPSLLAAKAWFDQLR